MVWFYKVLLSNCSAFYNTSQHSHTFSITVRWILCMYYSFFFLLFDLVTWFFSLQYVNLSSNKPDFRSIDRLCFFVSLDFFGGGLIHWAVLISAVNFFRSECQFTIFINKFMKVVEDASGSLKIFNKSMSVCIQL